MITHIQGKLVEKTPTYVVIDCNGIGYKIKISLQTFSAIDEELCRLFTHLSVKEDSHTLFGFYEESERHLFRNLISVSGVGPSTAQVILSTYSSVGERTREGNDLMREMLESWIWINDKPFI